MPRTHARVLSRTVSRTQACVLRVMGRGCVEFDLVTRIKLNQSIQPSALHPHRRGCPDSGISPWGDYLGTADPGTEATQPQQQVLLLKPRRKLMRPHIPSKPRPLSAPPCCPTLWQGSQSKLKIMTATLTQALRISHQEETAKSQTQALPLGILSGAAGLLRPQMHGTHLGSC